MTDVAAQDGIGCQPARRGARERRELRRRDRCGEKSRPRALHEVALLEIRSPGEGLGESLPCRRRNPEQVSAGGCKDSTCWSPAPTSLVLVRCRGRGGGNVTATLLEQSRRSTRARGGAHGDGRHPLEPRCPKATRPWYQTPPNQTQKAVSGGLTDAYLACHTRHPP